MKFKDYVEMCNELLRAIPESADYDVIYARDDEGNGYQRVDFDPGVVHWDGRDDVIEDQQPNAVVIN